MMLSAFRIVLFLSLCLFPYVTSKTVSRTIKLKMDPSEQDIKSKFHAVKGKHDAKVSEHQSRILKQDASNQHAIMRKRGSSTIVANSMSPHLSMHSTRGQEAGRGRRSRVQETAYGKQALPPDEATPFFDTYVLRYAFPTIAIICSCLACVLFRTMRMYQKERWKGTSYFHGARRSAESLLPGLK